MRQFFAAGPDAQPTQLPRTVGAAAPRAGDSLPHTDHRAGTHLDDLVVEPHLTAAVEKHVELLDARMGVPVARLLAGGQCVRGEPDVLHRQLVVDDATPVPRACRVEPAVVLAPLVEGTDLDDLERRHACPCDPPRSAALPLIVCVQPSAVAS